MDQKIVIFLKPLSENLIQLKEILSKEVEFDIYEEDDVNIALEVSKTLQPALWLSSDPKKSLLFMGAANFKANKILSKFVLLSQIMLSDKAVKKMNSLGIKDIIFEPIAPRKLIYKITLLIRSLPNFKKENSLERKNLVESLEIGEQKQSKELKLEKLILNDQEQSGSNTNQIKNNDFQTTIQNESVEKKKSSTLNQLVEDVPKNPFKTTDFKVEDDKKLPQSKSSFSFEDEINNSRKSTNQIELEVIETTSKNKSESFFNVEIASDKGKKSSNLVEDVLSSNKKSKGMSDDLASSNEKKTGNPSFNLLTDDGIKNNKNKVSVLKISDVEIKSENKNTIDIQDDNNLLKSSKLFNVIDDTNKTQNNNDFNSKEGTNYSIKQQSNPLKLENSKPELGSQIDLLKFQDNGLIKNSENLPIVEDEIQKARQTQNLQVLEASSELGNGGFKFENDDISNNKLSSLSLESEENKNKLKNDFSQEPLDLEKSFKEKTTISNLQSQQEEMPKKSYNAIDENDYSIEKSTDLNLAFDDEQDPNNKNSKNDYIEISKKLKDKEYSLFNDNEDSNKKRNEDDGFQFDEKNSKSTSSSAPLVEDNNEQKKPFQFNNYDELNKKDILPQLLDIDDSWEFIQKEVMLNFNELSNRDKQNILLKIDNNYWKKDTFEYDELKNKIGFVSGSFDSTITNTDSFGFRNDTINEDDKIISPNKSSISTNQKSSPASILVKGLEQDHSVVFIPNTRGMEFVINSLKLVNEENEKSVKILDYVAKSLYSERKGITSFLIYNEKTNSLEDLFISKISIPTLNSPNKDPHEEWIKYKKDNIERWKKTLLPTWTDTTFRAKQQEFIFPFYEGTHHLGVAVIDFPHQVTELESKFAETLLECARIVFLGRKSKHEIFNNNEDNAENNEKIGIIRNLINKTKKLFSIFNRKKEN